MLLKDIGPEMTKTNSLTNVHSLLFMSVQQMNDLKSLIQTKNNESNDRSIFEILRPLPEDYLADIDTSEYKNTEKPDIGDVAVLVVDGLLHDTKRSIWISKNWGSDIPIGTSLVANEELNATIFEKYLRGVKENQKLLLLGQINGACDRLKLDNSNLACLYLVSNDLPNKFFEFLSDTLKARYEFLSFKMDEIVDPDANFYDVVKRGSISDWGTNFHRKPFNLTNYPPSTLLVWILVTTFVFYLIYSYFFGA